MEQPTKRTCRHCGFDMGKYCGTCIWWNFLDEEMEKEYFVKLRQFIETERKTKEIYPAPQHVFNAFALCRYQDLKVVILGQDPYHTPGTAHGLAFSTVSQVIPPSLQNIFIEVKQNFIDEFLRDSKQSYVNPEKVVLFKSNNLTKWAEQGVLLLNTILTVEKGTALSHKNKGWEEFTKNTITWLNDHPYQLVYMLWGNNAKEYKQYINTERHLVLEAAHPSPYSANSGFFGCKHFSIANDFINKTYNTGNGGTRSPISWNTL